MECLTPSPPRLLYVGMPRVPTPNTVLTEAMRKRAVVLAQKGAPPRTIALALGFSTREFNRWMAVGAEEDEFEARHNASKADLDDERYEALLMYRAIIQAQATFATKCTEAIAAAVANGDTLAAQWWLTKRVSEFQQAKEESTAPMVVPQFFVPANGRDA